MKMAQVPGREQDQPLMSNRQEFPQREALIRDSRPVLLTDIDLYLPIREICRQ
jgi:hypothetical protein